MVKASTVPKLYTAMLLLLVLPKKGISQNHSKLPVLAITSDIYYNIPFFTDNAAGKMGLRIGVEYPLEKGFMIKCAATNSSFNGDFKNNTTYSKFNNTYSQVIGSIGYNIFELFNQHIFNQMGLYLYAGGGYLFSDVTATRKSGSFKQFEQRFWVHSLGIEFRYDVTKNTSIIISNSGLFTQTNYLNGIDNDQSKSKTYKYEWYMSPSVGVAYRIISPKTYSALNNEPQIPTIVPIEEEKLENEVEGIANLYSIPKGQLAVDELATVEALLTRIASSQDAIEKILASSFAFDAMRHDSITKLLKSKNAADSSFYASILNNDTIKLRYDTIPNTRQTYLANLNNTLRYPILAGNKYNVVVATYSVYDIDKAIDFIQNNPDYNLYLISGNKNSTKVRVCTHSTDVYANALTKLNLVRGKLEERAWIYKK